jgi:hypothetical protein
LGYDQVDDSLKVVHEEQIMSCWKRELKQSIGDVFAFSNLGVLEVKGQSAKVFAHYPDGINF